MDEKSKIIDRAQKLVQKGYLDKAITEYRRVIEKDPKDATIRLRIGDLYVKLNKRDEAIKEYGEVAKIHAQKGFYLKAIAVYKQILKLDEGLIDIHFKLAELYVKQRLAADAIAEYGILVNYFDKKGKYDDAIDILKRMIETDPQNIGVRLKLADYYRKRGSAAAAIGEYVVAFDGLLKEGKLDSAEKLYQGLYLDSRKDIRIIEGFVELYKRKGDNNQIVKYYKELADLYKEKGDFEKQKWVYEQILTIFPNDSEAVEILGKRVPAEVSGARRAPSIAVSDGKTPQESLISWPEVTIDLSAETKKIKEHIAIQTEEEPLIPWKEMIEIIQEPKPSEKAMLAEEKKSDEEPPPVETPELIIPEPKTEEEKIEEVSLTSEVEVEKPAPVEETLVETIEEKFIPEESPLSLEEQVTPEPGKTVEQPTETHEIEDLGIKEFLPEGARIVKEIEVPLEEGYIDLSTELGLDDVLDSLTESWASGVQGKETFTEFKQGVEKQLSREDTETHYNLGIAYMEMELYDDAMREFKIAMKDPVFELDCYNRLGLSFMAKGNYDEAISSFLRGLKISRLADEERKGLMYELGLAYEAAAKSDDALGIYKSIYEMDKAFREVSSKVNGLTKKLRKDTKKVETIPLKDNILEVEIL